MIKTKFLNVLKSCYYDEPLDPFQVKCKVEFEGIPILDSHCSSINFNLAALFRSTSLSAPSSQQTNFTKGHCFEKKLCYVVVFTTILQAFRLLINMLQFVSFIQIYKALMCTYTSHCLYILLF